MTSTNEDTSIQHVNIHYDSSPSHSSYEEPTVSQVETSFGSRQQVLTFETSIFTKLRRFYARHQFKLDTTVTVFLFLFDVYKILMGSFLTVFTYQRCDILNETFRCFDQPYELFALGWNLFTFVCCFVVLGFQIHREAYFIRELFNLKNIQQFIMKNETVTKDSIVMKLLFMRKQPLTTIEKFFEEYPSVSRTDKDGKDILEQIVKFNNNYSTAVKLSVVVYLFNLVFSACSLFLYMYMGLKTLTSFLSNVFLLGLLLCKCMLVVDHTETTTEITAYSAYKQDFEVYTCTNMFNEK